MPTHADQYVRSEPRSSSADLPSAARVKRRKRTTSGLNAFQCRDAAPLSIVHRRDAARLSEPAPLREDRTTARPNDPAAVSV